MNSLTFTEVDGFGGTGLRPKSRRWAAVAAEALIDDANQYDPDMMRAIGGAIAGAALVTPGGKQTEITAFLDDPEVLPPFDLAARQACTEAYELALQLGGE